MPPTVAVDAMGMAARGKGVPRTLVNLLRELPLADPPLEYVALVNADGEKALREAGIDVGCRVHSPRSGLFWELGGSARAARAEGARVLYTMREITFPRATPVRSPSGDGHPALAMVLHVHEPPWLRRRLGGDWPRVSGRSRVKDVLLSGLIGPALRRAGCVIASTEATGNALAVRFGIRPEVVHLGVDPAFLHVRGTGERERFLLHLASGDPRESTPRVLRAWARATPPGFRLIVAGVPPRLQGEIRDMAFRLGTDGTVEVLGWLTDGDLAGLYARAWALLGPTLYEGFGLEGLEALAVGTPVVAGDVPASREVLGEAGLFADASSVGGIERAIREITWDRKLWKRLHQAGPQRAGRFRWEASASRLADIFARVARTTPSR